MQFCFIIVRVGDAHYKTIFNTTCQKHKFVWSCGLNKARINETLRQCITNQITTASRTAALARGIKSATLNCVPLKLIERSTVSIKSTVIVSMERLCGEWRWRLTTLSINPSKSLVDLILPPSPVTLSKDNGQKENV